MAAKARSAPPTLTPDHPVFLGAAALIAPLPILAPSLLAVLAMDIVLGAFGGAFASTVFGGILRLFSGSSI